MKFYLTVQDVSGNRVDLSYYTFKALCVDVEHFLDRKMPTDGTELELRVSTDRRR